MKRVLFALFLSIVAGGISFYVILFCGLGFYLLARGVNPTEAPGLLVFLRHIALPCSLVLSAVMLFVGLRRKESRPPAKHDSEGPATARGDQVEMAK